MRVSLLLVFVLGAVWSGAVPATAQTSPMADLLSKAAAGDRSAQDALARHYYNGDGVAQDHEKALAWFRRAADQGYAEAQHSAATMYLLEEGTAFDAEACFSLYASAAAQGFEAAIGAMSYLYFNDVCLPEIDAADRAAATVEWSRRGIAIGDVDAHYRLGATLAEWPDLALRPDEMLTSLEAAAAGGSALANRDLAEAYEVGGLDLEPDLARAAQYHRPLAEAGRVQSLQWLARTGLSGTPVPAPDITEPAATGPDLDAVHAELEGDDPDFDALIARLLPPARAGDRAAQDLMLGLTFDGRTDASAMEERLEEWLPWMVEDGNVGAQVITASRMALDGPTPDAATKTDALALLRRAQAAQDPRYQIAIEQLAQELGENLADWSRPLAWYLRRAQDSPTARMRLAYIYSRTDPLGQTAATRDPAAALCWASRVLTTETRFPFIFGSDAGGVVDLAEELSDGAGPDLTEAAFLACQAPQGLTAAEMVQRAVDIQAGRRPLANGLGTVWVASAWLRLAAFGGNAEAQYRYARNLHQSERTDRAIEWARAAAGTGMAEAQFVLGAWLLDAALLAGEEEATDMQREGLSYINLAAGQGYANAFRELEQLYLSGTVLPKDEGLAALWGKQADDAGAVSADALYDFVYGEDQGLE